MGNVVRLVVQCTNQQQVFMLSLSVGLVSIYSYMYNT